MKPLRNHGLSEDEIRVLEKVPSHTFVAATTFLDAVTSAGLTWTEGKLVLASLLEKELIVDLNADTLDYDHGVCDRTPLGDLACGVFISIVKVDDGTFEIRNPPSYHQRIAGEHQGSVFHSTSYEDAFRTAKKYGLRGAAVLNVEQNGEAIPVDYLETLQDSCTIGGEPAPNVAWNWEKLKVALIGERPV